MKKEIKLLGLLTIKEPDGQPAPIMKSPKGSALLVYLLCTRQVHSREAIADILWEAKSTEDSLRNLRQLLSRVRKWLPELLIERKRIGLNEPIEADIDLFALEAGLSSEEPARQASALKRYTGELLSGFYLADAPQFMEWLTIEQERLRRRVIGQMATLCAGFEASETWEAGADLARHWLTLDQLDEDAHYYLMRFLAMTGQAPAARQQYETLRRLLEEELGVDPAPKTTALFEKIGQEVEQKGAQAEVVATRPIVIHPHNLPAQTTPTFGRDMEIEQLIGLLSSSHQRLITLVGEGGIGKSKLSLEVGQRARDHFRDGVWLVPLAGLTADQDPEKTERAIATVICETLFPAFGGIDAPRRELFTRLQTKALLLIIDNLEHLLDGADLIIDLLREAPQVKVLASSREPLGFMSEHLFRVGPLPLPAADAVNGQLSENPAVHLFADRAQRVTGQLSFIEEAQLPQVAALCRFLGGSPLGIELAAAGLRRQPLDQLSKAIETSYETLAVRFRDIPARHRSMRAVFENSWILLSPAEQHTFASCAVFRGGFDVLAGIEITGATVGTLQDLVDKSLLRQDERGRFVIHELLRQFAQEKLGAFDPAAEAQRHSRYFMRFLADRAEPLHGPRPQDPAAEIGKNLDNIRQGWQTAVENRDGVSLEPAIEPLSTYYELRGLFFEAAERFAAAAERFEAENDQALALRLRSHQIRAQVRKGEYAAALALDDRLAPQVAVANLPQVSGELAISIGEILYRQGHYNEALARLNKTLEIAQTHQLTHLEASAQFHRGLVQNYFGDFEKALESLQKAQSIWHRKENKRKLAHTLISLGTIFYSSNQSYKAAESWEEALLINEAINDLQTKINILNNLSLVAVEQKEFQKSRQYLFEALSLAEKNQDILAIARAYHNLGWGYLEEENGEMAKQNLTISRQHYLRIDNRLGEAEVLKMLGDSEQLRQATNSALRFYELALEKSGQVNGQAVRQSVLEAIGKLMTALKGSKGSKEIESLSISSDAVPHIAHLIQTGEIDAAGF